MYKCLPLLLLFACGQPAPPLTLSEGEIYDERHRAQIGTIAFFTDWVTHEEIRADQYLQEVDLGQTTTLNARMFLDKTITAHLHDLAPDKTVEELCAAGSFQFTFLVDDVPIFINNLPTGAGSCDYKNEATIFGIPLFGPTKIDHWGRFLWLKFMKLGEGETALESGSHQLTIEVRPYLDDGAFKTGPLIASGKLKIIATAPEVSPAAIALQPIAPTAAFPISTLAFDPVPIEQINQRIATGRYVGITSLVVLQGGELLLEEYFQGAKRESVHDTRSVGKSFAGTLLGLAIADGHLKSVKQPLSDFYNIDEFTHPTAAKATTTLEDLLTMRSSLACNDVLPNSPGNEENMYPTKDWVRFALNLPVRDEKDWQYCTAGVVLLGDIIHRHVPGGLEAYAQEKLFKPLGIVDQQWQRTPTGIGNTAGSLAMSSLSYAAYGQLYLEQGATILPAAWAQKSLQQLVARQDDRGGHYGYLFWHDALEVASQPYQVISARGNGGNVIALLPELETVVVLTTNAYGNAAAHFQADQIIRQVISALTAGELN